MQARDPLLVGLGQAIKELRKQRGLSQERLAHEGDAFRTYVGELERAEANPTVPKVARLAVALEIPLSELLARAEQRPWSIAEVEREIGEGATTPDMTLANTARLGCLGLQDSHDQAVDRDTVRLQAGGRCRGKPVTHCSSASAKRSGRCAKNAATPPKKACT